MTKELKDAWVAALRSGEYRQARGALTTRIFDDEADDGAYGTYGYCCLGVLMEIACPDSKYLWEYSATIADTERGRVGLKLDDHEHCIKMNDIEHKTFPQIADWIEENL